MTEHVIPDIGRLLSRREDRGLLTDRGQFIADFACHEARLIVEIVGGRHDPSSEREATRTRFPEGETHQR
jgi:hypothetical protein